MISENIEQSEFTLTAISGAGAKREYVLQADQGVFIGASSNCGLQLTGDGLSDIHCRVGIEDGKPWVQDWMSAEGTQLNGEAISTNLEIQPGDVIQIGEHQITVASGTPVSPVAANQTVETNSRNPAAVDGEYESLETIPEASDSSSSQASTRASTRAIKPTVNHDPIASPGRPEPAPVEATAVKVEEEFFDFAEEETFDRETVALLQAEIDDLRSTLAQRDAEQFCDDFSASDVGESNVRVADAPDEVLQRMQELIEEANGSDERVAILEELLHAADEANRSEQEERSQLEAWVGDIEKRIGQRENEHLAELDALRNRLQESTEQQELLQKHLRQAAAGGSAPKQYEQTLEDLQRSNNELQESLAEANKQRLSLEQRVEHASGDQDQALRGERAEMAQEQAKISRLRFELSSKLAAIEEMPKTENQADKETTHRIQALREHLREIHTQEKQDAKEASLGTRLAKLWKRVEY